MGSKRPTSRLLQSRLLIRRAAEAGALPRSARHQLHLKHKSRAAGRDGRGQALPQEQRSPIEKTKLYSLRRDVRRRPGASIGVLRPASDSRNFSDLANGKTQVSARILSGALRSGVSYHHGFQGNVPSFDHGALPDLEGEYGVVLVGGIEHFARFSQGPLIMNCSQLQQQPGLSGQLIRTELNRGLFLADSRVQTEIKKMGFFFFC